MATYEIRFQGTLQQTPPWWRSSSVTVFRQRAETVLFRRVQEEGELEALLDQLLSVGLVLTEVHELPLTSVGAVQHRTPRADEAGNE
jgi:hypothetical protein